jgi:hypothetical protein
MNKEVISYTFYLFKFPLSFLIKQNFVLETSGLLDQFFCVKHANFIRTMN